MQNMDWGSYGVQGSLVWNVGQSPFKRLIVRLGPGIKAVYEFGWVCSLVIRFTCQDAWPIKSGGSFHRKEQGERRGCARSIKNP